MDAYKSYNELKQHETEGEDYVKLSRKTSSRIAVIAPHGGGIEPGTADIADFIAGDSHTFYAFKGIKKIGNAVLHMTSNIFDEPEGSAIAQNAEIVVSIHGCARKDETVLIGGRNQNLKEKIRHALIQAGFNAEICRTAGLRGQRPENICNRCRTGEGVQLEISRGLREKMFDHLSRRSRRNKTRLFFRFAETLKKVIRENEE